MQKTKKKRRTASLKLTEDRSNVFGGQIISNCRTFLLLGYILFSYIHTFKTFIKSKLSLEFHLWCFHFLFKNWQWSFSSTSASLASVQHLHLAVLQQLKAAWSQQRGSWVSIWNSLKISCGHRGPRFLHAPGTSRCLSSFTHRPLRLTASNLH